MSTGASLLRGSISRTFELFARVGTAFLITPYLVHALGDHLYGVWAVVGALMGYCGLLEFGMSWAAARYMSQALARKDAVEFDRVASAAFLLFAGVAALAVVLTLAAASACPLFIHNAADAALTRKLLLIVVAAVAADLLAKPCIGLLMADIRYDLISGISIARTLLTGGAIYLCLRQGRGIVAVALATLAASLFQCGALFVAAKALFPSLRFSWSGWQPARLRDMVDYGCKAILNQLGDFLTYGLDSVLIAGFLGASMVTPYAIANRLTDGFTQLVVSWVGMMLPVFSRYEGRGDYQAIRDVLLKITKLSAILSAFIGVSVICYGRAFILRWMGPGYEGSYIVAAVLSAGLMLRLAQSPGVQMLYGMSAHKGYSVLSVCEGATKVILSLCLVKSMGIYGVALGTTLALVVFKLFIQPIYICRVVDLPVRVYSLRANLAILLKTGALVAAFYLLVGRFATASYSALAVCVAAQTLLFAPVAYFFILGRPERLAMEEALASLWAGVVRPGCPASVQGG